MRRGLADDRIIPREANPRVGADIDEDGNIAVAFSNYQGDTQELLYRNNSVCNVPFLYVNRSSESGEQTKENGDKKNKECNTVLFIFISQK